MRRSEPCTRSAFTLIELILVMAMLAAVIAVAAPSLSRFFKGQALDSEANRLLALTRYAQSRAVSEGIPMVLWINRALGTYGLRREAGFSAGTSPVLAGARTPLLDDKEKTFRLAPRLRFDLSLSTPQQPRAGGRVAAQAANQLPEIHFAPDGSIDESSLRMVLIREDETRWLALRQTENGLAYEITQNTTARRATTR